MFKEYFFLPKIKRIMHTFKSTPKVVNKFHEMILKKTDSVISARKADEINRLYNFSFSILLEKYTDIRTRSMACKCHA